MRTGYFEHCTFFALYRDNGGNIYSRMLFVGQPQDDPGYFFKWVQDEREKIKTLAGGGPVAMMDVKILEAVGHQYLDISNQ